MQKYPVCPRCSGNYVVKDSGRLCKRPYLLQCGHTFCQSCLLQMAAGKKTSILCPTCQYETQLQSGENCVKNLCMDRYITGEVFQKQTSLLEQELTKLQEACAKPVPKRQTQSDKTCKECSKKPVDRYCQKCNCYMCKACFQMVHSRSKTLQQHQPVCLIDKGQPEVSFCANHEDRPLEYYCEDHDMVICSRCVIHGPHKDHNVTSLEDKNQAIISDLEPILQMASHVHRRLKKINWELPLMLPDYKKEVVPVLAEIAVHFQHLHGLLQIRQCHLEQEVMNNYQDRLQSLKKLRSGLDNEIRELGHAIKDAQCMIKNSSGIIINAKEVLEKLNHARDIPCVFENESHAESAEKLVFDADSAVDTLLMYYGSVLGALPQRFNVHTMSEQPEKFTVDADDHQSIMSDITSQSEDVIIEDVQEIVIEDSSSQKSGEPKLVQYTECKIKSLPKTKVRGQNECVYVTHINTPHRFLVQLKRDTGKLAKLSAGIEQWVNSPKSDKSKLTAVKEDDLVLALYSKNKQWYRARIKRVIKHVNADFEKTNAEVLYIDYGNRDIVSVKNLKTIQSKLIKYPELSVECCLFNIVPQGKGGAWSSEAVKEFAKIVKNRTMHLMILRDDDNIKQVDLSIPPDNNILNDQPMSVRDAMIFQELACFETPLSLEPGGALAIKRNYITPSPKERWEVYPVYISYAGTPDCFYVQELGDDHDYLVKMMAQMQDTYSKKRKVTWKIICPQPSDNMWYRARIIGLPGNKQVDVQYVDYGNVDRVTCAQICKILDSFMVLPAQALCCKLMDVEPDIADGGWSAQSLKYWSEKVNKKPFNMKVINIGSCFDVVLKEPDDCNSYETVNLKIVMNGFGKSAGRWSEPQDTTVIQEMPEIVPRLSYQTASGSFPEPCNLSHIPVYWKSRNCKPTRRYDEMILSPPTSECLTENSASMEVSSKRKSKITDKTCLQASDDSIIHGQEDGDRSLLPIKWAGVSNGSPSKMSSSDNKNLVNTKKKSPEVSSHMNSNQTKIKESSHIIKKEVEVIVSHFLSPSRFSMQMVTQMDDLNRMQVDMNNTYQKSEIIQKAWVVGEHCAVLSMNKGMWCRGKVMKIIQKNLLEVFIMDFGGTEITSTSNLRELLRHYQKMRMVSFACKLVGLLPAGGMQEWSKTACEYMQDFISNKKLYVKKQGNPENLVTPVDLIVEEYVEETALEPGRKVFHSLVEQMKEQGLAIPMTKKRQDVAVAEKVYPKMYYKKADTDVKTGDRVMPVYVDDEVIIYCYTMEGDDLFQSMCDALHSKFKDSEPHGNDQTWFKGQAVAAYYSMDQQWHRANIVQLSLDKVQIHYLDYGNTEWVEYNHLRADVEEFTNIPQQTFLCILHDIKPMSESGKWNHDAVEFLHKEIVNKHCIITVVEKNGYMNKLAAVNLDLNGVDIGSRLVQYGLAKRGEFVTERELHSKQIEKILIKSNPYKTMVIPTVGESFPVTVTHLELPNVVYVQHVPNKMTSGMDQTTRNKAETINEQLECLVRLTQDINQAAPKLAAIPDPKKGMACCAQFKDDGLWYRAVIADVYPDTKQFLVLYVDFGNSEVVTRNRLLTLPPSLSTLPCQALRFHIAYLKPSGEVVSWTQKSLLKMMEAVIHKQLIAKVQKHNPPVVELYENMDDPSKKDVLIYQSLIDTGIVSIDVGETSFDEGNIDDGEKQVTEETNITPTKDISTLPTEQSVVIPKEPLVNSSNFIDIHEGATQKSNNVSMKTLIRSPVPSQNVAMETPIRLDSVAMQCTQPSDGTVNVTDLVPLLGLSNVNSSIDILTRSWVEIIDEDTLQ